MKVTAISIFIVVILIALTAAQENIDEEPKTITLDLKKRYTRLDPEEVKHLPGTIVSELEAKRRGLATVEYTMTNYNNLQYYSTLYIGDAQKAMTFIFDTGSTYLWVPLSNCSCHTSNLYTPAGSFSTSGSRSTITYGSGSVGGVLCTDNVRAQSSGTAVNMKMLGVDSETSMIEL